MPHFSLSMLEASPNDCIGISMTVGLSVRHQAEDTQLARHLLLSQNGTYKEVKILAQGASRSISTQTKLPG